ncbi:DUF4435 domain-containing protein [uncultured Polaribacter sp.]|uniref:DUF4435 domain-containing protein n=1 Tax=uncultured Polaribacter sp. TaxID=174711 RepID=UPI00260BFBBD|nr:DUF4435 domain-containing protein [uncultured Polaribacter sp.]
MSPQDLIEKSRNSPVVSFHKFVLFHRRYRTDLFCFYEGKDSQYYFPRINDYFGENHHPIICGNKKSVVSTFQTIEKKYPNFKTAFFIDKDFDENIHEDKIYNTPCYSIENLYCSEKVLKRVLKNEFMLKETDSEFEKIIDLFTKNQKEHHNVTSLFNIWYATAKGKAKLEKTIVNVSLNEKFPKDFATIKIGEFKSNYDLKLIKEKFPDAIDVNEKEIEQSLENFYTIPPEKKHRGKYEIEFFLKFLKYLIEDCNKNKKILKIKTKFKVEASLILTQLSQYSETPECLKKYIKNCA